MKITKGQLKRIIAEEHQLVFGKKPVRGKSRKTRKLQERKLLAERKKQILVEAKAQMILEEYMLMNEFSIKKMFAGAKGLFGGDKGLAGQIYKAASSVASALDTARKEALAAADASIKAMENEEGKAAMEEIKKESQKLASTAFYEFVKPKVEKMVAGGMTKAEIVSCIQQAQGLFSTGVGQQMDSIIGKLDIPEGKEESEG
mgnify:CR=1 FL=1